jgi:hypothetical protein
VCSAGGSREAISISCLSFSLSPTNAHVFKMGILVFQVVTLAKRQQGTPFLGSIMDSTRHWGFVIVIRGSFPEINS